mgnify:CR=1 FL=1
MKIIIVEDEKSIRNGLTKMLPKLSPDYEVMGAAKDGLEGYHRILDENPDLVIMDIQMPELDGIEATRRIRAFLPDIPIIAMTAHTMKGDAEKCLEAGMQDHIAKPIDPETLFAALQRARG